MKRVLVGLLGMVLALGLAVSAAEAQKKRRGGKKKEKGAPTSAQIAESMGELRWGMSKDDVMNLFINKVKQKYRPLIAKTRDAVEEDRLRQEAKREVEAIRKGYVEFNGESSGWDVSFLKGEFTHGNDESMLQIRDKNSQNFYFFIGDRLWKWYKAFDASVFPAGNFKVFSRAVERKFGKAKEVQGEMTSGEAARHFLEWQDKQTRLRAVDQSGFYGFYCLVFEEKQTVDKLARLRPNRDDDGDKHHAMVEAVTSERSEQVDDAPNIVDRITGRIRKSEQAPEQRARSASAKAKAKAVAETESSTVAAEDDPLSGLGL